MLSDTLLAAQNQPKPIKFTAPSGRVYTWDKPTPPTQDDLDQIVAFENSLPKASTAPVQPRQPLPDPFGLIKNQNATTNQIAATNQASTQKDVQAKAKQPNPIRQQYVQAKTAQDQANATAKAKQLKAAQDKQAKNLAYITQSHMGDPNYAASDVEARATAGKPQASAMNNPASTFGGMNVLKHANQIGSGLDTMIGGAILEGSPAFKEALKGSTPEEQKRIVEALGTTAKNMSPAWVLGDNPMELVQNTVTALALGGAGHLAAGLLAKHGSEIAKAAGKVLDHLKSDQSLGPAANPEHPNVTADLRAKLGLNPQELGALKGGAKFTQPGIEMNAELPKPNTSEIPKGSTVTEPPKGVTTGETGAKEPWQMTKGDFSKSRPVNDSGAKIIVRELAPNKWVVRALRGSEEVGKATFTKTDRGLALEPASMVFVDPAARRQGIGSALYGAIESHTGESVIPSGTRTGEGSALWDNPNRPFGHKDYVAEALHEGKPVPSEVLADYPELAKKYPQAEVKSPTETVQPNVEASPVQEPPTEPPPVPQMTRIPEGQDPVAYQQRVLNMTRRAVGLGDMGKTPSETVQSWAEEAAAKNYDHPDVASKLADEILSGKAPKYLDPAQKLGTAQALEDMVKRHADLSKQYLASAEHGGDMEIAGQLADLTDQIDKITKAGNLVQAEWGRTGLASQIAMNDGGVAGRLAKLQKAEGRPLLPDEVSTIKSRVDQVNAKNAELQARIDELTSKSTAERANEIVKKTQRAANKESVKKDIADAQLRFVKSLANTNFGPAGVVNKDTYEAIRDMAKGYAKLGAITFDEVASQIKAAVKDKAPWITDKHIQDAITGKYPGAETPEQALSNWQQLKKDVTNKIADEAKDAAEKKKYIEAQAQNIKKRFQQAQTEAQKNALKQEAIKNKQDAVQWRLDEKQRMADERNATQSMKAHEAEFQKTQRSQASSERKATQTAIKSGVGAKRSALLNQIDAMAEKVKQQKAMNQEGQGGIAGQKSKIEPYSNDPHVRKLTRDLAVLEGQWKDQLRQAKKKTLAQRAAEFSRTSALSGIGTFGNLGSAIAGNALIAPVDELMGPLFGNTVGKLGGLAEKAGTEFRFSPKAEIAATKALGDAQMWIDAYAKVRGGQGSIKDMAAHLGIDPVYTKDVNKILQLEQNLHSAIKTPTERNGFVREWQKQVEDYARKGLDVNDPENRVDMFAKSYMASKRALLQNDSAGTKFITNITSKYPATKVILPIAHIPINMAGRAGEYTFGLPYAIVKHATEAIRGNMTEESAQAIARAYKRGGTGAALFATGALATNIKVGDSGDVSVSGFTLPHAVGHIPWLEALMMGARWRQAHFGVSGLKTAVVQTGKDIGNKTPFVGVPRTVGRVVGEYKNTPKSADTTLNAASDLATGILIPQFFQQWARGQAAEHNPAKPKGPIQQVEAKLPYLQSKVPHPYRK